MKKVLTLSISLSLLLISGTALANGANMRMAGTRYVISMSSAPFTPVAGQNTNMTFSIGDLQTNKLIVGDVHIWITVKKSGTGEVLFPEKEFTAKNAVLDFNFTYPQAGFDELFLRFENPTEPGKIIVADDFLIDVLEPKTAVKVNSNIPALIATFFGVGAALIGFFIGRLMQRPKL